jgi:hypothetical protein
MPTRARSFGRRFTVFENVSAVTEATAAAAPRSSFFFFLF